MTTDVPRLFPHLGIGLIGGGFMSSVHAGAARAAGARLVGLASRDADSAERAARRLGVERSFADMAEMLADDRIDVVHICTPNATHADLARAALEAGKHVICEKPLATSASVARELADAAASAGLVAAVPFVYRFHPMVREARSRVRDGRTGRLFSLRGDYLQDWLAASTDDDWRVDAASGGPSRAFADIGSHLADLLEFVSGDPIVRLSARIRTVHDARLVTTAVSTEDVAVAVFETASGAVGTLNVSQVSLGHKNRLVLALDGERESLHFDQEAPELLRIGTKAGFLSTPRGDGLSSEAARYSTVPAGHPQGYEDAFHAFIADVYAAVATGSGPEGLPTFLDGARAALVTEAVLASSRSEEWVGIAPPERSPGLQQEAARSA